MAQEQPAGDGEAAPDPWDGVELDEDFVRAAGTSEPSARARMLAARWRAERPEPQPWRADKPPAGWFFSRSRRRRRRG
ncbi:SGM_3592 family protein [Streptomyces sp. NPDC001781]